MKDDEFNFRMWDGNRLEQRSRQRSGLNKAESLERGCQQQQLLEIIKNSLNPQLPSDQTQLFRIIMWSPFYEVPMYPQPLFMPMPVVHTIPLPFPILPSFSTFPTQINFQEKETVPKNANFGLDSDPESSQYQEEAGGMLKLALEIEDELLNIIKLLLSDIHHETRVLEEQIKSKFSVGKLIGDQFFRNLISKLKKLTKTKEQIVKYCIRKAFKFINEKIRDGTCVLDENDVLRGFLKDIDENITNTLPFKKHSHFKTMNSTFLAELFRSEKFGQLYHEFLKVFPDVCEGDNRRKIENLSKSMHKHILTRGRDMKKFNSFKRVPWTQSVMAKCYEVAQDLEKYRRKSSEKAVPTCDQ